MLKKRRGLGKKGENVLHSNIIFIILNLIFFALLLVFVYRSAGGALVYEQGYAKEIGLMLDKAKPGMLLIIDISKGYDIALKNKIPETDIVRIGDNKVKVSFAKNGGYSFEYFSDYKIESVIENKLLKITISEKE